MGSIVDERHAERVAPVRRIDGRRGETRLESRATVAFPTLLPPFTFFMSYSSRGGRHLWIVEKPLVEHIRIVWRPTALATRSSSPNLTRDESISRLDLRDCTCLHSYGLERISESEHALAHDRWNQGDSYPR
jgi:hypothetical protein